MILWFLKASAIVAVVLVLLIILARALFTLPARENREDSSALPPSNNGPLADALIPLEQQHPSLTGIVALPDGAGAFAARMLLAEAAVSSIDAQYYIWHGDLTGYLLFDALQRAANRGVRVRLLLDDNGTTGLDSELAALNGHPNIEIRLYNPFNLRRLKLLSYSFDFFRLNRRMHNKTFTVDGRTSVLGGRNVGDEYFGTGESPLFFDLDVLATGEIVPQISANFDRYWSAPAVHPAGPIVGQADGNDPIAKGLESYRLNPQMAEYTDILQETNVVKALIAGELNLEWTSAVLISDDPVKGEGAVAVEDLLITRLMHTVGDIKTRFDGVSPYFVPGSEGADAFAALESEGVDIRILTNSLEATDVLAVHAGYTKRRANLLQAGVELFELRKKSEASAVKTKTGPFGSSGASLHAKTFAVDGARIFVGSFNFDPRSTSLNTEMGLLIDSPTLAQNLHDAFDAGLEDISWQVKLQQNRPVWIDATTGTVNTQEPGSNVLTRGALKVIGWLPVEWLL